MQITDCQHSVKRIETAVSRVGCVKICEKLCSETKRRKMRSSGESFAIFVFIPTHARKIKVSCRNDVIKAKGQFFDDVIHSLDVVYRSTWCFIDCYEGIMIIILLIYYVLIRINVYSLFNMYYLYEVCRLYNVYCLYNQYWQYNMSCIGRGMREI